LIGGALYQVDPVLPYAFAAVVYVVLLAFMQWLGRRVSVHVEAA
jgi:ABC-type amino acid transport system permease subunit